jgi:hypothetical protein
LDANLRLTVDQHHVPVVFGVDGPTEHAGPEAALGGQIGGVEHDDLEGDLHAMIFARTSRTGTSAWPLGDVQSRSAHNAGRPTSGGTGDVRSDGGGARTITSTVDGKAAAGVGALRRRSVARSGAIRETVRECRTAVLLRGSTS